MKCKITFFIETENMETSRKVIKALLINHAIDMKIKKVNEKPETDMQKIVLAYKMKKGFERDDEDWDKMNFSRCSKYAKELLEYFGNWETVVMCIDEEGSFLEKEGLDWNLGTISKRASDYKIRKESK